MTLLNSQSPAVALIKVKLFIGLFLVITILIPYGQMLKHDFVYFDDNRYVTENEEVKAGLTVEGIKWAFTTTHAEFWHPLTWLSLMLDTQIFGVKPGGYLFTNLLLHICNTLLLFLILNRVTGNAWPSGFVAALFALHPLHVESVAWIAQRKDVLSTFFWMLAMLSYVIYAEQKRLSAYLAVFLSLLLGLMAKPMLVTLPFALLLFDYWPLRRLQYPTSFKSFILSASALIREKIPLIVIALAASIGAYSAQQSSGGIKSLAAISLADRIANALVSYIGYIGKMLWPSKLACFYPFPDGLPWWQVGICLFLLAFISWWAIRSARQAPYFIVGWLWYLATLLPVIGLIKIGGFAMADRYSYVPSIGVFIILTWGIAALVSNRHYHRLITASLAAVALFGCIATTWFQVRIWQNKFTLFTHALEVTSNNYFAHVALGLELRNQGKLDAAIAQFLKALDIKPNYMPTYINLGTTYASQGNTAEAVKILSEAVRRKPILYDAHKNLGMLYEKQGDLDQAVRHFRQAADITPQNPIAQNILGNALAAQGKLDEALDHYSTSLRLQPANADVHYNLGIVFEKQGKIAAAIREYSTAVKIEPNYAEAYYNLANLMVTQKKFPAAIDHYQKALSIRPDLTAALNNLALVYATIGEYEAAVASLLQMAKLQPDKPEIYYYVASLYARQNKLAESTAWLETAFIKGYKDCRLIKADEDLKNIRTSARYDELMHRFCP